MKIKKAVGIESIGALLLGFSTSLYVVHLAVIGSKTIKLDMVISVIIILLLLYKKETFNNLGLYFNKVIIFFSFVVIISGINALIYSYHIGHVERYGKALVAYLFFVLIYVCVILLKDYRQNIIQGLLLGLQCNIVLSIIQYLTFKSGNYLTLYNFFPQSSFYIPIYNFRTQGFFLEPSHMTQYIISTILLFVLFHKNGFKKRLIFLSLILILLLSKSGNFIVVFCIVILFYMIKRKKGKLIHLKIRPVPLIINFFVVILIIINMDMIYDFLKDLELDKIINVILFRDRSDSARLQGMLFAVKLIKEYPMGIGFGMSKTLFDLYTVAQTSYNYFLTVQLELGILGTLAYIIRIYVLGIKLILERISDYQIALGMSIIGSEIAAILNGGYFGSALWVLYGLASIEYYENWISQKRISLRN